MELVHCIYCSASTNDNLTDDELETILEQSRQNNARADITGVLLYHDGSFFQVLEGDRTAVAALFQKIAKDDRHTKVTKIVVEPIEERSFGEWSMGYPKVRLSDLANIPGLNDFFTQGNSFLDLEDGRAKTLLAAFKGGQWRTALS